MPSLEAVQGYLSQQGFQPQTARIGGQPAVTGQKRTFKVQWFATTLWENVVAFQVKALDAQTLAALIESAKEWAVQNKQGLMRGAQSGQAIHVVVHAGQVSPDARELAKRTWNVEFGRFILAGVTDGHGVTIPTRTRILGIIYRPHLKKRIHALVHA